MSRPAGRPGAATTTDAAAGDAAVPRVDGTVGYRKTARFAQLTYSSFERGDGGRGGWQVKEVAGTVTDDEQRFLVAGVATGLDDGRGIPSLPTAAELDVRPRRLVYAPVPSATGELSAAYWHTTSAGQDSSGRPGNVFAHVLLDRGPAAPVPPLRPSDLILAPQWLRPFGAQAVLGAALREVPPPPWADVVLGRSEVVAFLVDEATWRPGLLAALLDAVHAAMAAPDGPPVVLAVTDPERGVRWIAAVCHLMSAGTSRRLFWSTHERASGLPRLAEKHIRFAVLPAEELAAPVDTSGIVLIVDGEETVELGDLPHGESHRTRPHNGEIAVTPYSVVAAVVLQDPGLAEAVLERQDQIAAEANDPDLPCGWPLAVAVLERADELGDVQPEARRLVHEGPRAPLPRALARRVRRLLAGSLGHTAADALDQAEALGAGHPAYGDAVNVYYRRAIEDRGWLVDEEPRRARPVLPPEALDEELVEHASVALDACTAEGEAAQGDDRLWAAVPALRLIGFALAVGLAEVQDGVTRSLPAAIGRCLDRLLVPLLLDDGLGPELVARVGPLPEPIQDGHIRPRVDACLDERQRRRDAPPAGRRVSPDVLAWLYPEPPVPPAATRLRDRDAPIPATLAELAAQVTRIVPDPSAFRPLAARVLLESPGLDLPRRLARLAGGSAFSAADLYALVVAHDVLPLVPLLLRPLLEAPNDHALQALVQRVLADELRPHRTADGAVDAVLTAAELRRGVAQWESEKWEGGQGEAGPVMAAAELLDAATRFVGDGPALGADVLSAHVLSTDVLDAVIAARVFEVVDGRAEPVERPLLVHRVFGRGAPGGVVSGRVVDQLTRHLRGERLVDAAVAAQLGSPDPRVERAGRRPWSEPAQLWVVSGDRTEPVLDHVVRRAVGDMRPDDVVDYVRRVRGVVAHHLRSAEPGPAHDAFARQWWQGIGAGEAAQAAPGRGYPR